MKKIGLIKLSFLFCLNFGLTVQGQHGQLPFERDRPYIESVSVNPQTGNVTISWGWYTPQGSEFGVEEFVLFWEGKEQIGSDTWIPFETIPVTDPNEQYFSFEFNPDDYPDLPNPKKTSVRFSVRADNVEYDRVSLLAFEHFNTQITSFYDSCRSEIRLNWHRYEGWLSNRYPPEKRPMEFGKYHLMRVKNGAEVKIAEFESMESTSFTIEDIELNETHVYYIIAERSDGLQATSYRTSRFTEMPKSPEYIHALSVQYNEQGFAEIKFNIDPYAETRYFDFRGSNNPDYAFVSLNTFYFETDPININNNVITLTDIQTYGKTYYYRLEAWHLCMNKYVATSNTATAMWLRLTNIGFENTLLWDDYQKWGDGNTTYEIHREIGNEVSVEPIYYQTTTTPYTDQLLSNEIIGNVCYWIKAIPTVSSPLEEFAISNKVCILPESNIYIPSAFRPNSVNINNTVWKPSFAYEAYEPTEFLMILYDRTGAVVFETTNHRDGWNGQLMNGRPANEGVYTYFIRFKTAEMGRLVEKRGQFSLML